MGLAEDVAEKLAEEVVGEDSMKMVVVLVEDVAEESEVAAEHMAAPQEHTCRKARCRC